MGDSNCAGYFTATSVSCCGGKNLEQSKARSDVISDTVDI